MHFMLGLAKKQFIKFFNKHNYNHITPVAMGAYVKPGNVFQYSSKLSG